MVLQSKRFDNENTPPTHLNASAKSLATRLRTSVNDAARRRRARTTGGTRTPKYSVEQARRRSQSKSTVNSIRFNITSTTRAPQPVADVEMKDAEPSTSRVPATTIPIRLPRELGRPEYCEVSKQAIHAVDPELANVDPEYIREQLEDFGVGMLQVLSTVKANPVKDALPKELAIIVQDLQSALPTHMMAVYGPPGPTKRRRVTLFPVHSIVFASYCAKLPVFPPTTTSTSPASSSREVIIPVRPLCLPSPQTYPQLSSFLYSKRTDILLQSLLPCPPPPTLEQEPSRVAQFATRLAGTYTTQALLQHCMTVHGLWQNVCALGIFDDSLWDTMDLAWQVLLTSIAIGTGNPQMMLESQSQI